ncbi:MAG: alpha/beta hydrolase [Spirochaetes bacterium]|nr:alpha/beta hydrolase [Spirochaetota bacterium]
MGFIEINDKRIFYNLTGKGDKLVLLHDGFFSSMSWDSVRDKFSEKFYLLDYDRFGYGKSDKFNTLLNEDIIDKGVEELFLITKSLKFNKFSLLGHCLGGAIAILFAIKYPEKVDKLILESTGFFSDPKILVKSDWTFKPFKQINVKLKNKLVKMHGEEYAEKFWDTIRNHDISYIMNQNYNILNELKKIDCPVLLINGDRDFYFDIDHTLGAYKKLKNSKLWIVPGCNHVPHIEKKEHFIMNVYEFLV